MGFHLRLLDSEKALQTDVRSSLPSNMASHPPEQLKLKTLLNFELSL